MTRDELKALIRTEPGIRDTLESLEAEFVKARAEAEAIESRRSQLLSNLKEIEAAKLELTPESSEPVGEPELPCLPTETQDRKW